MTSSLLAALLGAASVTAAAGAWFFATQASVSDQSAALTAVFASAAALAALVASGTAAASCMHCTGTWTTAVTAVRQALVKQGSNPDPSTWAGRLVLFMMRDMNRQCRDAARAACAPVPGSTVVELGCADGHLLGQLADDCSSSNAEDPGRAIGVDISASVLTGVAGRAAATIRPGRFCEVTTQCKAIGTPGVTLDIKDATVDAVVHCHCVYFWKDLDAGAAEVARVLRPNGRHVFIMGPEAMLKSNASMADSPFRQTSHSTILSAFERAGMSTDSIEVMAGAGHSVVRMSKDSSTCRA